MGAPGARVRRAGGALTRGLAPADYAALAEEIGERRGERVRAAHQDGPARFRLALEGPGGRTDLVLDLDPDFPRVHLAPPEPAPASPSPLAASLRSALVGARIEGTETVAGERALGVRFSLAGLARTLWFEGFGRRANLYLLDESGRVLVTPRGEVAQARGASVGSTFEPTAPREEGAHERVTTEGSRSPSAEVARAAERTARARDAERLSNRLRKAIRTALRRAEARAEALRRDLEAASGAEAWRRKGELLSASFHLLKPGAASVRVPDYSTDPPGEVEVELDPNLPPADQVASCFERARKAERTSRLAAGALERTLADRERLAALETASAAAAAPEAVERLREEAAQVGVRVQDEPAKRKGPQEARPWREFESADGWRILVGRDAAGNDALTSKHARPEDLFLHVRGGSGSHVIVPTPRGKTVPKETLLDAAELACFFSSRREAERNEVDHAEKRYVRKPRGAPAGLVHLERSRTILVRRDDDRRRRLLGRPEPPSGPE